MPLRIKREPAFKPVQGYLIPLTHGLCALVSGEDFLTLGRWKWKAKKGAHCFYAVREQVSNGTAQTIYMHRFLTNCPGGFEVHHKNFNSLDNRQENLQVVDPPNHKLIHAHTLYQH